MDVEPNGTPEPLEDGLAQVVAYLRRVAQSELAQRGMQAPQATSLVDRAFLRLLGGASPFEAKDAEHLRRTASRAIRYALRDAIRAEKALKRGGDRERVEVQDLGGAASPQDETEYLDALIDELDAFGRRSPQAVPIVEQILLLGATRDEVVRDLGVEVEEVRAAEILFRDFYRKRLRS